MTTTVEVAAEIIGIGRTMAYDLLRENVFPVPVIRLAARSQGRTGRVLVPVAGLLTLLAPHAGEDRTSENRFPEEREHAG